MHPSRCSQPLRLMDAYWHELASSVTTTSTSRPVKLLYTYIYKPPLFRYAHFCTLHQHPNDRHNSLFSNLQCIRVHGGYSSCTVFRGKRIIDAATERLFILLTCKFQEMEIISEWRKKILVTGIIYAQIKLNMDNVMSFGRKAFSCLVCCRTFNLWHQIVNFKFVWIFLKLFFNVFYPKWITWYLCFIYKPKFVVNPKKGACFWNPKSTRKSFYRKIMFTAEYC